MYKIVLFLLLLMGVNGVAQENYFKSYAKDGLVVNSYNYQSIKEVLERKDDSIYVINFWATWCLPCVKELPYFEKLNQEYKDKKLKVILISLDMPNKIESVLIPFLKKKNMSSEVIHLNDPDANSWIEKVDKNWSGAIPATYIYKGQNSSFFEKSFTYEELEKEVNQFINK